MTEQFTNNLGALVGAGGGSWWRKVCLIEKTIHRDNENYHMI